MTKIILLAALITAAAIFFFSTHPSQTCEGTETLESVDGVAPPTKICTLPIKNW